VGYSYLGTDYVALFAAFECRARSVAFRLECLAAEEEAVRATFAGILKSTSCK
jgi:hypothetical protein